MTKKRSTNKAVSETNIVYVFVDAANLRQGEKTKGRFLDYKKVGTYIAQHYRASAVKIFHYSAYPAQGTRDYDLAGKQRYYDHLKKELKVKVRKKALKRISVITEHGTEVVEKGNMDVELVIDAMHTKDEYHNAVLMTGDSDFAPLVKYLRRHGKKTYVFSFSDSISHELRNEAFDYTDLSVITEDIWGMKSNFVQSDMTTFYDATGDRKRVS